ncbi:MFS transporter [Cryptosporangium aurantiacum]|uniref:Na+/melibiose symporter n=1 Tax=Cryptosporangium aurantiacum TaxID=134849 RepID=A0A1M7RL92_9ACTN|nr:MFS transporter [Cryptosporangium aurantiacum]SHN47034.1 Na+/melibiose symporter [Cryptosporangium aurantiacum]
MSQPSPLAPVAQPRKAALAAWIGSALEYYDFFIYGTAAALVFNKVFFPDSDPATGTLLALATFGVGYAARPIGAFILGHIGDKFGRKRVLVFTLMLMGVSTFLVGCLPTYDQVGVLAPTLLVLLRLAQGFSAAGEQASANSMTLEHAPEDRRGFFTSFTLNGTQMGQILATAAFLPVAALPESALLSWGWRIPFLLSVVVMAVGYLIRRRMEETPVFAQEVANDQVAKMPLAVLFRDHWVSVIRVILIAMVASVSTIFGVYALSFGTDTAGLERSTLLWVGVLANVVALGAIPLWARLSDRIGRKPVMIGGTLGSAALMFAYLSAVGHGNYVLIFAVGILLSGVVYSAPNSTWPAFYGEMFTTRVRLSGMAIGTQIGFAIGGFAPTIGAAIAGDGRDGWLPVAIMLAVLCLISAAAAATARETAHVPTEDLGRKPEPSPDPTHVSATA